MQINEFVSGPVINGLFGFKIRDLVRRERRTRCVSVSLEDDFFIFCCPGEVLLIKINPNTCSYIYLTYAVSQLSFL